ncbi:uncharacterized protein N7511_010396 [Penicillium nucicola]|uniref:uncharacterized protein n=1 Tax=Penicillium nucicola TaxID=1850975 RepID=UPI00254513C4|nr:uncharacterized protein N7511_010396 [Penicillium nucicola]KAJ5748700.1 hypothetical protein N7511_010396 [Penicillium nucicola]
MGRIAIRRGALQADSDARAGKERPRWLPGDPSSSEDTAHAWAPLATAVQMGQKREVARTTGTCTPIR